MGPPPEIIILIEEMVEDDLPDITPFNSTQVTHPAASSDIPAEAKRVYEAQEQVYKAKEAAWKAIEEYYKRKINKEFNS